MPCLTGRPVERYGIWCGLPQTEPAHWIGGIFLSYRFPRLIAWSRLPLGRTSQLAIAATGRHIVRITRRNGRSRRTLSRALGRATPDQAAPVIKTGCTPLGCSRSRWRIRICRGWLISWRRRNRRRKWSIFSLSSRFFFGRFWHLEAFWLGPAQTCREILRRYGRRLWRLRRRSLRCRSLRCLPSQRMWTRYWIRLALSHRLRWTGGRIKPLLQTQLADQLLFELSQFFLGNCRRLPFRGCCKIEVLIDDSIQLSEWILYRLSRIGFRLPLLVGGGPAWNRRNGLLVIGIRHDDLPL